MNLLKKNSMKWSQNIFTSYAFFLLLLMRVLKVFKYLPLIVTKPCSKECLESFGILAIT